MQKQAQDYNERINQLTDEYTTWGIKNSFVGKDLLSADEMMLSVSSLTIDQIIWIKEFIKQWEDNDNA